MISLEIFRRFLPYVSHGYTTMFADTELKEVLKQVEAIKSSIKRFELDQTVATKMCRLVDAYLLAAAKRSVKPTNLRVKARVKLGDSLVRARSKSISMEEVLEEAHVQDKMNPLGVFAHGGTDIQSLFVEEEGEKYNASIGVHSKCKVAVKRSYKRDDVKAKISGFERSKYLRASSNSLLFHYNKSTMASFLLAPEQILGKGESQASDCFNLGGLLYYV
ncbi:hypothetical protein AALP_AAs40868U000100, partial [Arabis alpina]